MSSMPRRIGRNGCGTRSAAESRGDGLGGGVRELRRDAALLHREARDVAGGVDVLEPRHARVRVDRDEAVERLRQAVQTWPPQARQCDGAIARNPALG